MYAGGVVVQLDIDKQDFLPQILLLGQADSKRFSSNNPATHKCYSMHVGVVQLNADQQDQTGSILPSQPDSNTPEQLIIYSV